MFIRAYLQDTDVSQEKLIHPEADLGFKYTSRILLAMNYRLGKVKKPCAFIMQPRLEGHRSGCAVSLLMFPGWK